MSKFYGVKVGKNPGVYETWEDCKSEITGFKGAVYKAFKSREEAEEYVFEIAEQFGFKVDSIDKSNDFIMEEDKYYLYTDGSFNKESPTLCGYGGVIFKGNKMIDCYEGHIEEEDNSWNVTGEVEAVIKGVYKAIKLGIKEVVICYDYEGIEYWITGEFKCKKDLSKTYKEFMLRAMDKIRIKFHHVKGHSGVDGNEIADLLAKKSINNIKDSEKAKLKELLEKVSSPFAESLIDLDEVEPKKESIKTIIEDLINLLKNKRKIFALEEVKELLYIDNNIEIKEKLVDILKLNLDDNETALLITDSIKNLLKAV